MSVQKKERVHGRGPDMYQVVKRDGKIGEFDIRKISAGADQGVPGAEQAVSPSVIDMQSLRVTSDFEPKIKTSSSPVGTSRTRGKRCSPRPATPTSRSPISSTQAARKGRNINSNLLNYKDLVDNYSDQRLRGRRTPRHLLPWAVCSLQLRRDHRNYGSARSKTPRVPSAPLRRHPSARPEHASRYCAAGPEAAHP
jgi:hypothetical protein